MLRHGYLTPAKPANGHHCIGAAIIAVRQIPRLAPMIGGRIDSV